MFGNWPFFTVIATKARFEPNGPTSQTGAEHWSCWPELGWVNDILWPRTWTWGAESGSFGHISWGQMTLWIMRQPCPEKQIELVHRRQGEKRGGWRSRDKEPRISERRCMRGQLPWTKDILVSPKAPKLVILRFHEITCILRANSLSHLHYLMHVCIQLALEQRGG